MEPSAGDDDSDDAEVFCSDTHHQPATDVTGCPAGQQQYDCQVRAAPSSTSVPMWSECLPISVKPFLHPTDADMHATVDFMSGVRQGKKTALHANFQTQVYNFLERPTGWKCFLYHFSV